MSKLPMGYMTWALQNMTHMSMSCERKLEREIARRFERRKNSVPKKVFHQMPKTAWDEQIENGYLVPANGYLWCAEEVNTTHTANQQKGKHRILITIETKGLPCYRVVNKHSKRQEDCYYKVVGPIPLTQIKKHRAEFNRYEDPNHNFVKSWQYSQF